MGELQANQRIRKYRIVRTLGRASIKVLADDLAANPEIARRFIAEARAVNLVRHPGIVDIYEVDRLDSGVPYFIMEFLDGVSLFERLRQMGGRLEVREAMHLGREIALAMAMVHEKAKICHTRSPKQREIKPHPTSPAQTPCTARR